LEFSYGLSYEIYKERILALNLNTKACPSKRTKPTKGGIPENHKLTHFVYGYRDMFLPTNDECTQHHVTCLLIPTPYQNTTGQDNEGKKDEE
jgi:hypothetical protein